ncbi:MAG: MgtC/SapB family protein [Candidatus Heteroscillospira sp.]
MPEYFTTHAYEVEGLLRLLLAALLGGIMGLERTRKRREAGFRTYMLVALGSAMTVLVGEIMYTRLGSADTSRIAAAAVSGVGFIGAGSILVSRSNRVMGLTTAAGIWVSVTVGLAIGCGYYIGGTALVAISIVITMLGEKIQERFLRHSTVLRLSILFNGGEHVLPFIQEVQALGCRIDSLDMASPISGCVSATMLLHVPLHADHQKILEEIRLMSGVAYAEDV